MGNPIQYQKTRTLLVDNSAGTEDLVFSLPADDQTINNLQVFVNSGEASTIGVEDAQLFGQTTTPIPIAAGNSMNFVIDQGIQASRTIYVPIGTSVSFTAF